MSRSLLLSIALLLVLAWIASLAWLQDPVAPAPAVEAPRAEARSELELAHKIGNGCDRRFACLTIEDDGFGFNHGVEIEPWCAGATMSFRGLASAPRAN